MKHLLTIALICAGLSLKAQSISFGRSSKNYVGSSISDYGKGEYELPGAKYIHGKLTVTDSAKAINELMKSYVLLNEIIIPKIYQEWETESERQRKLTDIYKRAYKAMSDLNRNMLSQQRAIISGLSPKKKHK